jgi:hypothetical protein
VGVLLAHRRGCRTEVGSDAERVAQALLRHLRMLRPDQIEQFQELWIRAQDELCRWPVWDAATLLLGPLDDDTFLAVQDWIVSHGRQAMQRVQDDPDSLVELASDRTTLGSTGSAACRWRHTWP